MNNIQATFTIQDLELITGIKAHTIRIWEKRYDLLNPTRLGRNIRMYDLPDLQKILNISLLYNNNYKISKLSKYTDSQLAEEAKAIALTEFSNNYEINSLLISMYTFDEELFNEIYAHQIKSMGFAEIFIHTYLPLLNHIGLLWQTESIKPVHEHFISNLIYQKIVLNISAVSSEKKANKHVNILFLPEGEIHELGLLFLKYYLKQKGESVVYLGKSIPFENLFYVNSQFKEITWMAYFMIDKTEEKKQLFVSNIEKLLMHTKNKCVIIGRMWGDFSLQNKNTQLIFKGGMEELVSINENTLEPLT